MNYPVWYLPETGGGILIALIAIFHVFVSHFAVGGGLYLIYSEKKALREKSEAIMDFTKKHARFFILLTMVFGSITGVGIWFIIALVNPAATSYLIHSFVFGWAAEWVFFVVEIVAAFVYFYMFGKMDSSTHLLVGWIYFIAAWMSLFLINGIIGAMLTPGIWAENMDFWAGFFNPSFFPSLVFRTFIAIMIAACYGYFSAAFSSDEDIREEMTSFSAKWALAGLLLAIPAGYWYLTALPEPALALVMGKSPTISSMIPYGLVGALLLMLVMLVTAVFRLQKNLRVAAVICLCCAFLVIGSFEWVREAARRPYVINEVMYSNSIKKNEVAAINEAGYLQSALWIENRELTSENLLLAGEELFIQQCYACHTLRNGANDIASLTSNMSHRALVKYIEKIHQIRYFMPPFVGTSEEASALAAFLVGELHGKPYGKEPQQQAAAMGALLFEDHCSSCHAADELVDASHGLEKQEIDTMLLTLDEISDEMEPFAGTDEERGELTSYLHRLGNPEAEAAALPPDGALLFEDNCSACHGPEDLAEAAEGLEMAELVAMLRSLDEISDEMEPFAGSDEEAEALAQFMSKPMAKEK